MRKIFEQLEVNIASVIIGALFFLITVSWIEAFKSITDKIYFDDKQEGRRYSHQVRKKLLSALLTTILSIAVIIVIYILYTGSSSGKKIDDDSFPGIIELGHEYDLEETIIMK